MKSRGVDPTILTGCALPRPTDVLHRPGESATAKPRSEKARRVGCASIDRIVQSRRAAPLPLRRLRDLDLTVPTQVGRNAFFAAASDIVLSGVHLLVVADDELHLGVFGSHGRRPGIGVALLADPPLPLESHARKAAKPDFEALGFLPPELCGSHHGAVIAIGSGSKKERARAVVIDLGADGAPVGRARVIDLAPLYEALGARIPDLNIEGVAFAGGKFFLAQRGNGAQSIDALVELDVDAVREAVVRGARLGAAAIFDVRPVQLGRLGDTPLTLTSLSPLPDGRMAFTAAAEGGGSTYEDGAIAGSAVGVMDADGRVHALRRVSERVKLEGIHATAVRGGLDLLLVDDPDDPSQRSGLFATRLPLR